MTSTKTEPERRIEEYFNRRVKDHGGKTEKLAFLGRRGAPDRLVGFAKWRYHCLVELKREGETLRRSQRVLRDELVSYGLPVIMLDSKAAIDVWLQELRRKFNGIQ
jgi:hypothetical protein